MRIALLGGTGDIGEGLALRWGLYSEHDLVIGSRSADKARTRAGEYDEAIANRGGDASITGAPNEEAAAGADIVVLSVPPEYVAVTVETVGDVLQSDSIVVSPAVSMSKDETGFHYVQPDDAESVTAVAASATPDDVATVGAFHNVSADRLANLDADLDIDTLVVADSRDAATTVAELADEIPGMNAVHAGPLENAPEIEGITPLLINVARYTQEMHHVGVSFD